MFLSLLKVTSSFLLSTQSLCSGIIFTAAFPADSIFRLPCACHTTCSVSSCSHKLVEHVKGKLKNWLLWWNVSEMPWDNRWVYFVLHVFLCPSILLGQQSVWWLSIDFFSPLFKTWVHTLSCLATQNPGYFRWTVSVCLSWSDTYFTHNFLLGQYPLCDLDIQKNDVPDGKEVCKFLFATLQVITQHCFD